MKIIVLILLAVCLTLSAKEKQPNILWLTTEDHGPHLGCYGDTYATTPNLDRFAKRSLRYTKASSNCPICAPARTTLVTGMYAPSLGAHHMRSEVDRPKWVKFLPELLRSSGYYCSNSSKTDYNFSGSQTEMWDESSKKAHYKNRPEGKPFFAVFNQTCTHESQIRNKNENPHHDPAKAPVPPYHPDTPEVRKDWAQYYDRLTKMDQWVGKKLEELEDAGLADDTIVFFFSDHGSGMPRHKRYVGWSGLSIPLLVYIPEAFNHLRPKNYQAGGTSDRLVSFVDFAPTLLSLCGIEAEDSHQGHSFLGTRIDEAPKFSFGFVGRAGERPDESRSIFDGRHLLIHNLMPHVPLLKGLAYQMETKTTSQWKEFFDAGKLNKEQAAPWKAPRTTFEIYDLSTDPHETKNLFGKDIPAHQELSNALAKHLKESNDLGVLTEAHCHFLANQLNMTLGDFAKSKSFQEARAKNPKRGIVHASLPMTPPKKRAAALRDIEKMLGTPSNDCDWVRLLEIRSAFDSSSKHIDALLNYLDPKKTSPYVIIQAYDAISRAQTLTAKQYSRLKNMDSQPGPNCPKRVAKSIENFKKALLKQFKP